MIVVALGWQVYNIHHSTLDLGSIGLAEFVPLPLLALPAGALADRASRRVIAARRGSTASLRMRRVLLAVTAVGRTHAVAVPRHRRSPESTSAIGSPATRALTPELVPGELLQGAIALRNVAGQIGVVAGPALGGLIFYLAPTQCTRPRPRLLAVAFFAFVALPPTIRRTAEPVNWENLVAGVNFIVRTRMMLGASSLDLFGVLLGDLDRARAGVRQHDPPHRADRARRPAHRAVGRRAARGDLISREAASLARRARRCSSW